jgi:hypothetical protein
MGIHYNIKGIGIYEKAEGFLNMYYGQYEKKDKIKEIANQSNWGMQIQERICLPLQPRGG